MKPLHDYLLVKLDPTKDKTESGLIFTPNKEERIVAGTVIAVGSGRVSSTGTKVAMESSVNDRVLFNKSYATEVKHDNDSFWLVKEENIFALLND